MNAVLALMTLKLMGVGYHDLSKSAYHLFRGMIPVHGSRCLNRKKIIFVVSQWGILKYLNSISIEGNRQNSVLKLFSCNCKFSFEFARIEGA